LEGAGSSAVTTGTITLSSSSSNTPTLNTVSTLNGSAVFTLKGLITGAENLSLSGLGTIDLDSTISVGSIDATVSHLLIGQIPGSGGVNGSSISITTALLSGSSSMYSNGHQNYSDALVLDEAAVFSGVNLNFSGATLLGDGSTGGENLTINTSGVSAISEVIGSSTAVSNLGSLTLNIANTVNTPYAGSLSLSGLNYYSGGTNLEAGTLILANNSSPTTGTVTAGPVGIGTLNLNGGYLQSDATGRTIANAFSVGTSSTATIGCSGSCSFTLTLNGTGTFNLGSTLDINNSGVTTFGGNLQAQSNTTVVAAAAGEGSLIEAANAQVTFNGEVGSNIGSLLYPLNTVTLNGTTIVGSGSTTSFNANTLTVPVIASFSDAAGSNNNLYVNVLGNTASTDSTIAAIIGSSFGELFLNTVSGYTGKLIVTNTNNAYTAGTQIDGGILNVSADTELGALPNSPATNITLNGLTATLELSGGNNASPSVLNASRGILLGSSGGIISVDSGGYWTYSGNITGTGELTLGTFSTGTGALTVGSANSTYSGNTIINAGLVIANANSSATSGTITSGPFGTGMITINYDGTAGTDIVNDTNDTVGSILQVSNHTLGNSIELNGGSLVGSNQAQVNGAITVNTLSYISSVVGGQSLTITNTINSTAGVANPLVLEGPGAILLENNVGASNPLSTLTDEAGNLTVTTNYSSGNTSIYTTQEQEYLGNQDSSAYIYALSLGNGNIIFDSATHAQSNANDSIIIGQTGFNSPYAILNGNGVNLTIKSGGNLTFNSGTTAAEVVSLANANLTLSAVGTITVGGGIAVTGTGALGTANSGTLIFNTSGGIVLDYTNSVVNAAINANNFQLQYSYQFTGLYG
jgi:autotransporter-associated beta strand protein